MKELASYSVESEGVPAEIAIVQRDDDYINHYELRHTRVKQATKIILDYLKRKIVDAVNIRISEVLDPRETEKVKKRLVDAAHALVKQELKGLSEDEEKIIVGRLIQDIASNFNRSRAGTNIIVAAAEFRVWPCHSCLR